MTFLRLTRHNSDKDAKLHTFILNVDLILEIVDYISFTVPGSRIKSAVWAGSGGVLEFYTMETPEMIMKLIEEAGGKYVKSVDFAISSNLQELM